MQGATGGEVKFTTEDTEDTEKKKKRSEHDAFQAVFEEDNVEIDQQTCPIA